MNRDDIIRMAQEAFKVEFIVESDKPRLERFAALVAAAEREECAKVCEDSRDAYDGDGEIASWCAYGIRARGQV